MFLIEVRVAAIEGLVEGIKITEVVVVGVTVGERRAGVVDGMGVGVIAADGQAGVVQVGAANLTCYAVVVAVAIGAAEIDIGILEVEAVRQIEVGGGSPR